MKTTIILLTILSFTMTSFTINPERPVEYSSEQMAIQVVTALQHSSTQEYVTLFPSLQEFHQMMDENSLLYGDFLPEAKEEFAVHYESDLIPLVKESFDRVLREGKKIGINWNTIQFKRTESIDVIDHGIAATPVTIVFSSNGKEYKLSMEKALVLHARWKVSQFIKLV
jgi:hypothetical protein